MASAKQGNQLQFITLTFFILGNLFLGTIFEYFSITLPFVGQILIAQWGFVGISVVVYLIVTHAPILPTLFLYKPHILDILLSIGIAFSIMPLLWTINVTSLFFVKSPIASALATSTDLPFLLTLFLVAITPAFLEELLTRSLILHNFKQHPVFIVALISGSFFGFIHLNINQFLYAFVMGLIMSYVIMITGTVIHSMVIHFTINASGVVTLYLFKLLAQTFQDIPELQNAMTGTAIPSNAELLTSLIFVASIALVATPIAGLFIYLLLLRNKKSFKNSLRMPALDFIENNEEVPLENVNSTISSTNEKIVTPIFIATIVTFISFVVLFEFILPR